MMSGWAGSGTAPSATFGPGMMNGLNAADRAALQKACGAMHDAIFGTGSDEATPTPAPGR